ncbi:MAG: hypothetical protein KA182_13355, partial [Propionivibrio sp.]|nr:hypothetical protein [Propionivibrio sp.]
IHCVPPKRKNKETNGHAYDVHLTQPTTLARSLQTKRPLFFLAKSGTGFLCLCTVLVGTDRSDAAPELDF